MTRIQILKDDLTKQQIRTLMGLEENEQWTDWTIYEDADYIIGETENDSADDLMTFLIDELELDEDIIEVD